MTRITKLINVVGYRSKVTKWVHGMSDGLFHGRFSKGTSRKQAIEVYINQAHRGIAAIDGAGNLCGVLEPTNHETHITFSILANPGYGEALINWLKRAYPGKPIGGCLRDPLNVRSTVFFMRHCDFLSSDLLSSVVTQLAAVYKVQHHSEVTLFYHKDRPDPIKKATTMYPTIFNKEAPKRLTKEVLLLALMFESDNFISHVNQTVFHVLEKGLRLTITLALQATFRSYCLGKGVPEEYFDRMLIEVLKMGMPDLNMSNDQIEAAFRAIDSKYDLSKMLATAYGQSQIHAEQFAKEYKR